MAGRNGMGRDTPTGLGVKGSQVQILSARRKRKGRPRWGGLSSYVWRAVRTCEQVGPRRAGSFAPRSGVKAVPVGTNLVSPTQRSRVRNAQCVASTATIASPEAVPSGSGRNAPASTESPSEMRTATTVTTARRCGGARSTIAIGSAPPIRNANAPPNARAYGSLGGVRSRMPCSMSRYAASASWSLIWRATSTARSGVTPVPT